MNISGKNRSNRRPKRRKQPGSPRSDTQSVTTSQISTNSIEKIIDKLRFQKNRDSTRKNYHTIWKLFNQFYIKLDRKPTNWDERLILFVGYLINTKKQSSTVRSYISAIRTVLQEHGIKLSTDQYLITSLTKACKLVNDQVRMRLPIKKSLLEVLLRKVDEMYKKKNQPYLRILYKCLLSTMYFGLFRIGELTKGQHVVKAKDVFIGTNKKKFLFILWTSKTHWKNSKPQQIKISSTPIKSKNKKQSKAKLPCPYKLLRQYLAIRRQRTSNKEQFFVFQDGSPVKPEHLRKCLKRILKLAGYDESLYTVHSLRSGRSCDLLELGVPIEIIKIIGRWRSNAIYTYLK